MTLNDLNLVIVDIETTGGRYYNHRIIEIGILKVEKGRVVKEYHSLVDPGRSIPAPITMLTGINDEMVKPAPSFREIHEDVLAFLEGSIFVAHNARFDYGFIRHELERCDIRFRAKVLCSLRLSRRLFSRFKHHNLSAIIDRFDIKIENRHRAIDDARAVWEFFKVVQQRISPERQERVISQIVRQPSIPPRLKTDVEDIPETPGVYLFRNDEALPLYIGKAKNLRSRVLSHFSDSLRSNKEVNLSQGVTAIETIPTQGELAALLLESYLIKTQSPMYNRQSRRTQQLIVLKVDETSDYHSVSLVRYDAIYKEDLPGMGVIFKSPQNAEKFLEGIAREYQLCKTLLGLESKTPGSDCIFHQMKQCKGACMGIETSLKHNLRLKEALLKHQRHSWPFAGAVMIEESNSAKTRGEVVVVDHWIIQEAFRFNELGQSPLFTCDRRFDLDAHRILSGYLLRNKQVRIKEVPQMEVVCS